MRSTVLPAAPPVADSTDSTDTVHEFLLKESVCAVAAESETHKFFFIYIDEVIEMEGESNLEDVEDESDDDNDGDDDDDHDVDDTDHDEDIIADNHGHQIPAGCSYIKGRYLEQDKDVTRGKYRGVIYKLIKEPVFFYKETVVYPIVNYEWKGKKIFISNNAYCDVLRYVEAFGMSSI